MSTSGISDSLTVYGAHFIAAGLVTAGVCKLAQAINNYCFHVEASEKKSQKSTQKKDSTASLNITLPKVLVPFLGACAGVAVTWLIATNPKAQYLALSAAKGALIGDVGGKEGIKQLELLAETLGPRFSSLSSILSGVAATALSCWTVGKIS